MCLRINSKNLSDTDFQDPHIFCHTLERKPKFIKRRWKKATAKKSRSSKAEKIPRWKPQCFYSLTKSLGEHFPNRMKDRRCRLHEEWPKKFRSIEM